MDPALAAIGHRLPPHSRVISSAKDYTIVRLHVFAAAQHMGIIWDPARTEFVLDIVSSLTYRDLCVRDKIIALAPLRGRLTVYYGSEENLNRARAQIQDAANAVLSLVGDEWEVLAPIPVPIDDFILDRKKLPANHPLRIFPERYQLGVVNP
jgi:hypothetical protein